MKQKVLDFLKKYYTGIILTICFVIGFAVSYHYGAYWDQDLERGILLSNVKSYSEASEVIGDYTELYFWGFPDIQSIEDTVEMDHGIAVYLPMFPMIYKQGLDMEAYNAIQHFYTFVVFFLGVVALYYLAKELTKSKKFGLLIVMLYYTAPRFFAEGHYNNKDMMLLSLMLMTYAVGYACVKKPKVGRCILFALLGALATNMKIVGAVAPGIIGLIFILSMFKEKEKTYRRERTIKAILTVVLLLVFYYLLTPAMWGNIGGYFGYIFTNAVQFSRWDGFILFNGEVYQHSTTGLPAIYLFTQYFLTTPLLITALALIGFVYMFIDAFRKKTKKAFWSDAGNVMIFWGSLSSLLLMSYAAFSGAVVYNSWRHFYFCFTGVLFVIIFLFKKIKEEGIFIPRGKLISTIGLTIYFVVIIGGMIINHPHQYAYFNVAAGADVHERYEIDYWCVSYAEALTELSKMYPDEVSKVRTFDYVSGQPLYTTYGILPKEVQEHIAVVSFHEGLEYDTFVVDNLTYSVSQSPIAYENVRNEQELVYEVKAYGNVLTRIYRIEN